MQKNILAIGIDLGTTHSLVAVESEGKICIFKDESGQSIIPSVVRFLPNGEVIVGSAAKAMQAEDAQNTISSVKRLMGVSAKSLNQSDLNRYTFTQNEGCIRLQTCQGEITPVAVSAHILKKLMQIAHQEQKNIFEAVITVPAYFDDAQRQATKDAARVAGIKVLRLLNEPTAAAIAYGLDKGAKGNCLVYDLGGGTFDVSILQLTQGVFEVLATGGDPQLGGDDIDHLIVEWMLQQANLNLSDIHYTECLVLARQAKEMLSTHSVCALKVNAWEGSLTLENFKSLIQPLVSYSFELVQNVLRDAKLSIAEIDHVILVGGSTRIPLIQEQARTFFKRSVLNEIDPDQAVVVGAALQASILTGNRQEEPLLLDVLPLSIGIEMMGGMVEKVLLRNSPIPQRATQVFTTYQDGQTAMSFHVVQGERESAKDCRSLATFDLLEIPPMPAGKARIEVVFQIDLDGLLTIEAVETTTQKKTQMRIKPTYGLAEDQVNALIQEAIDHAEVDMINRKLQEKIVEAKTLLLSLQKALTLDAQLLTQPQKQALLDHMQALEKALNLGEFSEIKMAFKALESSALEFTQLRLNAALATAVSGKKINDILKPV